ncbi:adenylate/guanylate cyclase domain-containing protein [Leisingera daeponensis]|uniref:Adenylate/guanylate cyclase domain-containing protein n=1 Tax=Leisingera daeponensis TaxID=405746 RepID=A0ABS7NH82_9RHOB|nr:adenylate/guanylate cyclase domain-containing protein [Leisingera daeponensis]MBY6140567.1 adenylate/guanylate cyclase domain-containing protein [Leisingera daeponensis]
MIQIDVNSGPLIAWLMEQGLQGAPQQDLLQGYCQRLVAAGVPLWRFTVAQRAFHPKFGGLGFWWTREEGIRHEHYEYRESPREEWLRSPFFYILEQDLEEYRERLEGGAPERFPLLGELHGRGATDYFAAGVRFAPPEAGPNNPLSPHEGMLASWSTDRKGGFSSRELDLIRTTLPHLGLALKSSSNRQMASDLLQVYLGRDAGRRVLSGEIQRGSSQQIDAVICLFDLKGFTQLSERLPGAELIDMLNGYFGLAVESVQSHGGNILKFMGDGMLAMFNLGSIEEDAHAALAAANELCGKVRSFNAAREAEGLPTASYTLALHAGDILYGNIGAENRLDFTVIGQTVNQTARIADMHRSVGQSFIISEVVKNAAEGTGHDLVSLGRYMLRGVAEPIELYTIYGKNCVAACAGEQ